MLLTELLNIDLPIIQSPMAGVQDSELAAAVSNAGGLGSLPAAMLSPEVLRAELAALAGKTSKPFNLNFFCHAQTEERAGEDDAWQSALAPFYQELDVEPPNAAPGPSRAPFNEAAARIVCEFKPAVVSFHFGLPSQELVATVRDSGAKILSTATTVAEALWLQARGVDAIIAQGIEAGGHRGIFLSDDLNSQIGTLALVRQVVEAVNIPVIAAGGIADARGVAAAMAMGAAGVQVGTAYLLCPEATTSAVHRSALVSGSASITALTNVFTGRPARSIVNRLMAEVGPISVLAPGFPRAAGAVAPLRAKAESRGSGDFSPLWSGQNNSGCCEVPAAELTRRLAGRSS